jgi:hypothetical protein
MKTLYLKSNPRSIFGVVAAFLICLLLSSCGELHMADVSSSPTYSHVIGKKIMLKRIVVAYGISYHYDPPPKYFVLISGPGVDRPPVFGPTG